MTLPLLLIGAVLLGFAAYVRLASSEPARWHIDLEKDRPAVMALTAKPLGADVVQSVTGGAYADLFSTSAIASELLGKLDAVAMAAPQTARLAGSVDDGRITWITRSAVWGFPDYTTAQVTADGLTVYSRLRFGREDMGVNAARLKDWLSRL